MKIDGIALSEELKMLRTGGSVQSPKDMLGVEGANDSEKVSFSELLGRQLSNANSLGLQADRAMEAAVAGEVAQPHSTIIAVQKASISLTLMMSIKERLERAYQELIRTPLG